MCDFICKQCSGTFERVTPRQQLCVGCREKQQSMQRIRQAERRIERRKQQQRERRYEKQAAAQRQQDAGQLPAWPQTNAPLAGLSLDEIAALARDKYAMSYGKLVAYVHMTGQLPPERT